MLLAVVVVNSVASFPFAQSTVPFPDANEALITSPATQLASQAESAIQQDSAIQYVEPVERELAQSASLSETEIKQLVEDYLREREASQAVTPDHETKNDLKMSARWNDGLELSTQDKKFRTHIGGRYQFDTSWFGAPENVNQAINVPYGDGVDFRRARLRVDGTLYGVHEYAAEFDFVNSARVGNQLGATQFFDESVTAATDLWWQIKEVPLLHNIKIGSQKEQIGFEHIVSSRFLPLMERSFNQDAFYGGLFNGFQPGVTIFDTYGANENGVWNFGIFKPTNNVFSSATGDGDYAVCGRLTNLIYYAEEGRRLVHVGISGRQASAIQQTGAPGRFQTFRTRDAIRSGLSAAWPVPAGITLLGDDTQKANGEFVSVFGPLTWQSEYLVCGLQDARRNPADAGRNVTYHGGYAQIGFFLTGENDHYHKKNGAFERIRPHSNFFSPNRCGGINGTGAWQVVMRYNHLDLNDNDLNGGILNGYTAGLNWFWNPNMKMQFNFNITDRDVSQVIGRETGSGQIYSYGTRMAMDF